jgi:hypothetical protein
MSYGKRSGTSQKKTQETKFMAHIKLNHIPMDLGIDFNRTATIPMIRVAIVVIKRSGLSGKLPW